MGFWNWKTSATKQSWYWCGNLIHKQVSNGLNINSSMLSTSYKHQLKNVVTSSFSQFIIIVMDSVLNQIFFAQNRTYSRDHGGQVQTSRLWLASIER